ncbi:MAG: signal peptidase II, partial [Bacteroidales bacterium]|nr:signal peptidase II [Bacteroidales bacterium]
MALSKGKRLLILGVVLVVVDQVMKILVKTNMTIGEHFNVIGHWFQILFIENKGMAFGMSFGGVIGKYFLTVFRIGLFAFLCWWIAKLLKRENPVPTGVLVGLTLITAGAMGNIIDCLFYGMIFSESTPFAVATLGGSYAPFMQGKVVDMLYFPLWTWPDLNAKMTVLQSCELALSMNVHSGLASAINPETLGRVTSAIRS